MPPLGRGGRRRKHCLPGTHSTSPCTQPSLRDLYSSALRAVWWLRPVYYHQCWQHLILSFIGITSQGSRQWEVREWRIFQHAQWGCLLMDFETLDYQAIKNLFESTVCLPAFPQWLLSWAFMWQIICSWAPAKTQATYFRLCTSRSSTTWNLRAGIKAHHSQSAGHLDLSSKGHRPEGSQPSIRIVFSHLCYPVLLLSASSWKARKGKL